MINLEYYNYRFLFTKINGYKYKDLCLVRVENLKYTKFYAQQLTIA